MIKYLFLCLCVWNLSACAADAVTPAYALDADTARGANAITARQTADAAQFAAQQAQNQAQAANARAAQFAAEQTAIAQATHDTLAYAQTRTAMTIALAQITRQAELDRATATESARRVNLASAETAQAHQETRAAVQTQTRRADEMLALSAAQTRTAAYPTQTRQSEQVAEERAARAREAQIKAAQAEWDARTVPLVNIGWSLLPFVAFCAMLFLLLVVVWKMFRAFEQYLKAKALEVSAPALAQMQIRDASGRPIGYLQMHNGSAYFQPYYDSAPEPPLAIAAESLVPLRDMVDRAHSEQSDKHVLNGFIHQTSLRAFVAAILESGDWTQNTWADRELPRGFILTKDTRDERGNIIYGNYARLLELFVQNNLIINRRKGAAGQWNPHAPRTVDEVIEILYHERPRPALPETTAPIVNRIPAQPA